MGGTRRGTPGILLKVPEGTRQSPTTRCYAGKNANFAKVEKPHFK